MPAQQKWQMRSRVDEKRERQNAADANWKAVCAAVTKRDAGHCRVCGRRCDPFATGMLRRGEHHHIQYRSAQGEDSTANVVLLCLSCHQDEHAGRITIEGNGDVSISVWRKDDKGELYMTGREVVIGQVERD